MAADEAVDTLSDRVVEKKDGTLGDSLGNVETSSGQNSFTSKQRLRLRNLATYLIDVNPEALVDAKGGRKTWRRHKRGEIYLVKIPTGPTGERGPP